MTGLSGVQTLRKKSLHEATALNILLTMLVVFVHVSSAQVTAFTNGSRIWGVVFVPWRLVTINVRSFIFISGLKLFYSKSDTIQYGRFYLSRFTKIFLPYLLWTVIYYIYFITHGYFDFSAGDLLRYICVGDLVGPFYFVIVIIQYYALAPLWMRLFKKTNPVLMLGTLSVLTLFLSQYLPDIIALLAPDYYFPYTDRVFTSYLFFWAAGCYAGLYYDSFIKLLRDNKVFITAAFIGLLLLEAVLSYISFSGIQTISWLEPIHYLYCLFALLFLYKFFSDRDLTGFVQNGFVKLLNRSTYHIYLLHSLLIIITDDWLVAHGITRMSVTYLIRIAVVYTLAITLTMLWSWAKDAAKTLVHTRNNRKQDGSGTP